jgi:hypothetical protein
MATDARGEKIGAPARLEKSLMEIFQQKNTVSLILLP